MPLAVRAELSSLACGAVLAAWGCGSSGASAPTTPSPNILIAGPATLVVGQVVQYTATTTSGEDVTIKSNWVASDSSVVRSTHSGLVTAIAAGTVTLTANYQTTVASMSVVVNPAIVSSPAIAACGLVVTAGTYFLDGDIAQSATAGFCLTITGAGVHLDCRNHSVSGILVSGATDVTIGNCVVTPGFVEVKDSSNVTLEHDTASTIGMLRGHDNAVLGSLIDGGYDGRGGINGQDDGILIGDQTNDRIDGNTIQNVWDDGIEGLDVIANTVITNNTIVNTGSAGIGAAWCTSWSGNRVASNTVSRSPNLMYFYYNVNFAKCLDTSTPGAFADNRMVGNVFRDVVPGGADGAMYFLLDKIPASSVSNNLIQGNDMGNAPGPFTVPTSGFLNGGGNICSSPLNPFCGG